MSSSADRLEGLLRSLSTLRIAKELFFTDWYDTAFGEFGDDDEALQVFRRIQDESRQELDAAMESVRRWADVADPDVARSLVRDIRHVNRRDFLQILIEAKSAAGEVFERAAILAPPELKDRFRDLAAIDFRHANALRDVLRRELERAAASPDWNPEAV